jgi:sigma-B regulation protein RsbU (phosphoserine phosphatase)
VAQARLKVALQSAQLHVWDLDPASGVRHLDASVGRLLGVADGEPVSVERFIAAVVPEDRERALLALSKAVAAEAPVYEAVYRVNGVDGVQRTVGITGGRVIDEATGAVQYVGVLQDISDITAQRAAAEDRAAFAEQMMAIVSHDLRNPLFAIDLSANYLGRSGLAAPQAQAVERIAVSVARAKRLTSDLLDFTQARVGGGLAVQLRPMNLHDSIARFVEELSFAYPDSRIEHRTVGKGGATGDPDRIAQLLGNLVSNAVAYGHGAGTITVTSRIAVDQWRLEVHNEGTPIPPDVLPSLFAPMARGEQAAGEFRSIGLGLFIVSEIARAHRGRVEVVSTAADGTRFSLVVPRGRR